MARSSSASCSRRACRHTPANYQNSTGRTALHLAVRLGHTECATAAAHGADPPLTTNGRHRPSHAVRFSTVDGPAAPDPRFAECFA